MFCRNCDYEVLNIYYSREFPDQPENNHPFFLFEGPMFNFCNLQILVWCFYLYSCFTIAHGIFYHCLYSCKLYSWQVVPATPKASSSNLRALGSQEMRRMSGGYGRVNSNSSFMDADSAILKMRRSSSVSIFIK